MHVLSQTYLWTLVFPQLWSSMRRCPLKGAPTRIESGSAKSRSGDIFVWAPAVRSLVYVRVLTFPRASSPTGDSAKSQLEIEMEFVAMIQNFSVVDRILAPPRRIGGNCSSWAARGGGAALRRRATRFGCREA